MNYRRIEKKQILSIATNRGDQDWQCFISMKFVQNEQHCQSSLHRFPQNVAILTNFGVVGIEG